MGGMVGAIAGAASGLGPAGAIGGDVFGQKVAAFLQDPATKLAIAGGKKTAAGLLPGVLGKAAVPIGKSITGVGKVVKGSARAAGLLGNVLTK